VKLRHLFPLTEAVVDARLRATPRTIRVSKRFLKDWPSFANSFVDAEPALEDFLRVKALYDPPVAFGKKDGPLQFIKGYWHSHLVFGRVIVFYRIERDDLWLYRVTDHSVINGERKTSDMGLSLVQQDNHEWSVMSVPSVRLPDEQDTAARDLFSTMMEHHADYTTLMDFAAGRSDEVLVYVEMVPELEGVPPDQLRAVAKAVLGKVR